MYYGDLRTTIMSALETTVEEKVGLTSLFNIGCISSGRREKRVIISTVYTATMIHT